MVKTRSIEIRVTKEQHERIKQMSQARGFGNMSAFLRALALDENFELQEQIQQIYRHLIGPEPYRPLRIRLTRDEYEQAQERRRNTQHRTLAALARSLLLGEE